MKCNDRTEQTAGVRLRDLQQELQDFVAHTRGRLRGLSSCLTEFTGSSADSLAPHKTRTSIMEQTIVETAIPAEHVESAPTVEEETTSAQQPVALPALQQHGENPDFELNSELRTTTPELEKTNSDHRSHQLSIPEEGTDRVASFTPASDHERSPEQTTSDSVLSSGDKLEALKNLLNAQLEAEAQ